MVPFRIIPLETHPLIEDSRWPRSGAGKSGLSSQFKRIMERAQIGGRILRAATGQGRKQSSLSFHSLRRGFVSALANAGVASDLRQKLAGHTDSKSHARYSHHEIDAMRSAIATSIPVPTIDFGSKRRSLRSDCPRDGMRRQYLPRVKSSARTCFSA